MNMKNILLCLLLEFEIPKNYIEKMDNSDLHLYDIFNLEVSTKDLARIMLKNRNSKKVADLITNLRNISDIELVKTRINSISLLSGFGATGFNLKYLRENDVHSISELRFFLKSESVVMNTPYGREHFELFKKLLFAYDDWVSKNKNTINAEFDLKNSKLNSESAFINKQNDINLKKKLHYFQIEYFPDKLSDFLQMDFKNKDILEQVMEGYTLQKIGNNIGVTRERIRQIKIKIKDNLPEFDDVSQYRKLFEDYKVTKNDFKSLMGESEQYYNYLAFKYGNDGQKSMNNYVLLSSKIDLENKKTFFGKKNVLIDNDGKLVKVTKDDILNRVLSLNPKVMNAFEYRKLISEFVHKNKLSEKYIPSERGLNNTVDRLSAIRRTGGLFRYYDLSVMEDYEDEIKQLFEVNDGIYGVDYFFNLDPNLMNDIGIKDASELANLIRRIGYDKISRIKKIERQSQVWIGDISPEMFYKRLLMKYDGQNLDNLLNYVGIHYQLNSDSVKSLISSNYKKYLHNNTIVYYAKLPINKDFYKECSKELNMPIYSYDMLTYKINTIDAMVDVTPQLLVKLGFYERGAIVFKKEFGHQQAAIDNYLLKRDFISTDDISQFHNRSIDFEVYNLELSHDLLKVTENKYMTISKFKKAGFSKKDLLMFLESVKNFVGIGKYFSWKSIVDAGFDNSLIERTGFDRVFFERLIFTMPEIRTIRTLTPIFLMAGSKNIDLSPIPPLSDFLEQVMDGDMEDIDELCDDLESKYGLYLDKDKIIYKIRNSNLLYSPEMRKVYRNEKVMFDDIYD
ncbi:sigma factor-like helix-turn-helix DNA-binding protein [Companilactobacillus sp. HBUAS59544]|uniref:sigma factor-like helix-turn-helix DNA-binding protein n=1 Tax=Companilactobacillus sp. HBUAS59544 TaxID=3109363 RepID=UPI002FEEB2A8